MVGIPFAPRPMEMIHLLERCRRFLLVIPGLPDWEMMPYLIPAVVQLETLLPLLQKGYPTHIQ